MSYLNPSAVPSIPGDPYVAAAERAFHLGMSTHAYLRELRAAGIEPIRMAGAVHVRESEHATLVRRLHERQTAAATAKAVQPAALKAVPSASPALDERLSRQEAELAVLRQRVEQLTRGLAA